MPSLSSIFQNRPTGTWTGDDLHRLINQTERAILTLLTIGAIVLLGFILTGFATGFSIRFVIWAIVGALAATVIGGAVGLLFGLPTPQSGPVAIATQTVNAPTGTTTSTTTNPANSLTEGQGAEAKAGDILTTTPTQAGQISQSPMDTGYRDSTSLEQIADWLTKIIVGLTLTQFAAWEAKFAGLSSSLTAAMLGEPGRSADCLFLLEGLRGEARLRVFNLPICEIPQASTMPGGTLIALFATVGFLISYLWMRRYFILEMVIAKKQAEDLLKQRAAEVEVATAKAQVVAAKASAAAAVAAADAKSAAALAASQTEADRLKSALANLEAEAKLRDAQLAQAAENASKAIAAAAKVDLAEQSPERPATADQELADILDRGLERLPADSAARGQLEAIKNGLPQAPTDPDDPWRGKFDGTSSANGTVLEARIEESPNDPNFFLVNLNVRIDEEARKDDLLGTKVIYFLHPTFPNQPRISAFGEDGRAPLELYAYGAFTVGAFLEDGTKLELNLATIEGAPIRFRSK